LTREDTRGALAAAVRHLLRPLVRLLLRNAVPFKAFAELAKQVYVDVARDDFALEDRRPSISRVSVLTGLTRKDVSRLLAEPRSESPTAMARYSRSAQVLTGWLQDDRFSDGTDPRPLAFEPDFRELCRAYSGDMPARAVLDELLRVGAVEERDDGRFAMTERGYVPRTDEREKLHILGSDVADLIATIDHNIERPEAAFFQRKVAYDNLQAGFLPALRALASREGQALLERLNQEMQLHDADHEPELEGPVGRRAMLGVYYYEEDTSEEDAARHDEEDREEDR